MSESRAYHTEAWDVDPDHEFGSSVEKIQVPGAATVSVKSDVAGESGEGG